MGNYVWSDLNGNGLQDGGEPGVDGVTVELLDAGGSVISNTVTAGGGFYSFTNLDPGTYSVRFTAPDGTQLTSQDAGDDALDSDADPSTGETAQVTLAAGENNDTIDAGLVDTPVDPASLGNYVWSDLNGNGLQDGESQG
ncbi:carboxypeptidase regulatory-like domain-containing protein [Chloroflexi bacterium TSY]|nr:carboxypeptidase regulatory-like domain-containing protein [Chloroflexi bacterium TSY]